MLSCFNSSAATSQLNVCIIILLTFLCAKDYTPYLLVFWLHQSATQLICVFVLQLHIAQAAKNVCARCHLSAIKSEHWLMFIMWPMHASFFYLAKLWLIVLLRGTARPYTHIFKKLTKNAWRKGHFGYLRRKGQVLMPPAHALLLLILIWGYGHNPRIFLCHADLYFCCCCCWLKKWIQPKGLLCFETHDTL